MKEKYIFFILLLIAVGLFAGSIATKKAKDKVGLEELAIEKKIKKLSQRQLVLPEKIDLNRIQDLVAFSNYEEMIKRSPFFMVQPKQASDAETKTKVVPVEEKTPKFIYKGKINSAGRQLVIIGETRSGETFMVSKGENVTEGYKVLDITETEVIISKKGEENIVLKTIEGP